MIFKKKKGNAYCQNCKHKVDYSDSLCDPPIEVDDYYSRNHVTSRLCGVLNKNNNCTYFQKSKGYGR